VISSAALMKGVTEPSVLGSHISVLRDVAADVWGADVIAGLVSRLDDDLRALLADDTLANEWVPVRHHVDFTLAVWDGLCGGRADDAFLRWIDEVTARGWGKRSGLFTSFADPMLILRHAQDLWRKEYSHGKVSYAPLGPKSVRLTLRDHAFTETEGMRAAIAESLKHVAILCKAPWAKETHELSSDGALHITIVWG